MSPKYLFAIVAIALTACGEPEPEADAAMADAEASVDGGHLDSGPSDGGGSTDGGDAGPVDSDGGPEACRDIADGWDGQPIAPQAGTFVVRLNARPASALMNGLMGLSRGTAGSFDDVAMAVRFNDAGFIDVRDGDLYRADQEIAYVAGDTYALRIEAEIAAHRYSVFIMPPDGTEVTLASDFAFRTTQSDVPFVDHWVSWNDTGNGHTQCAFRMNGEASCGDGVRSGDEACDDGNRSDGDCCNADCTLAAPSDTVCRPAADACDLVETCGGGGSCPVDARRTGDGCGFRHPGILLGRAQLNEIAARVEDSAEPWHSAFVGARDSRYGARDYRATPYTTVECGSFNMPNIGCDEEIRDANAAYTQALLWTITDDPVYAENAIAILDAWASTVRAHTNSNAPLMAAWTSSVFVRAAEIMRYTSDRWSAAGIAQFETMLRDVFLPLIADGTAWYTNGNWELSMIEGTLGAAVFLEDEALFERAVAMWRRRVPAYVYLESDGPFPVLPEGATPGDVSTRNRLWHGQRDFTDGLCQETCRDLGHVAIGLASMVNAAETAELQGVDLFSEEQERITKGFEFHTAYLNGAAIPSTLCGGELDFTNGSQYTYEVGHRAGTLRGVPMPETARYLESIRPTGVWIQIAWETLTHGR
ncbi:MAG: alginate lyase family protein [Sandaracinaceae bacterium]